MPHRDPHVHDPLVNVGLVQMQCVADREVNLAAAEQAIRAAAAEQARLICLPELFLTPYFCQTEDHRWFAAAEPVPGPTTHRLAQLAAELQVVVVASLFERRTAGLYHNTCVVIDADGSYLGKYRKMHIPDDPQFYEKFYFTPGDLGFRCFQTRYAKVGVLICWDQWFPEAARLTVLHGAEILLYPTAIGWLPFEKESAGPLQHQSWHNIQVAHATANGCFVAAVNRVGREESAAGAIDFWGQSFLAGPNGATLARASSTHAENLVCQIDLAQIEQVRTAWPFLRDRRVDAYLDLTERFLDESVVAPPNADSPAGD